MTCKFTNHSSVEIDVLIVPSHSKELLHLQQQKTSQGFIVVIVFGTSFKLTQLASHSSPIAFVPSLYHLLLLIVDFQMKKSTCSSSNKLLILQGLGHSRPESQRPLFRLNLVQKYAYNTTKLISAYLITAS